ncbi:MAG: hypothetical protein ABDI20_07440, partial [Candidatus Bipolaricaulaceae bacterium]
MGELREDLRARPSISPARRATVLGALGPAVHRALRKGQVHTRAELARLVDWILARPDERRGLGEDLGATRRWAEWCVREGLKRLAEERAEREASEQFLREFWREAEEARRAWQAVAGQLAPSAPSPPKPDPVRNGRCGGGAGWPPSTGQRA